MGKIISVWSDCDKDNSVSTATTGQKKNAQRDLLKLPQ